MKIGVLCVMAMVAWACPACGGGSSGSDSGSGTTGATTGGGTGAGGGGGSSQPKVTCATKHGTQDTCETTWLPDVAVQGNKDACVQLHGTVVDSCPAQNLVGCCTRTSPLHTETCSYADDSNVSHAETDCVANKGTWSKAWSGN